MQSGQLNTGANAVTVIAVPWGTAKAIAFGCDNGVQGLAPAVLRVAIYDTEWHVTNTVTVAPPRARPSSRSPIRPRPALSRSGGRTPARSWSAARSHSSRDLRLTRLAAMIVIVAGVSGSGKTTVGAMLAGRLSWRFADADAFHPTANIEKMHAGIPLTDDDRWPWLRAHRGLDGRAHRERASRPW